MSDQAYLERLYKRLLRLAECCSASAGSDADEAVSEALEVATKKVLDEKQAVGVFRTCLVRVRSRRYREQSRFHTIPVWYDLPESQAGSGATSEEVQQAIRCLSPRQERLIHLRYLNGRKNPTPYNVIGEQEGVSGERIRQLIHRALDRLRAILEKK